MTGMFLSRVQLRADTAVRAIAPLLLPANSHARLLAAHRLVWSLMSDVFVLRVRFPSLSYW